jgi:hypothetical protein
MTDSTGNALDSAAFRLGDRVDVHRNGHSHYIAYVEDTMPQLNIVWIREMRTGERRMLSTDECHIYRPDT